MKRMIIKKKNESGYLTVEATLALTSLLFFMMCIFNVGQVYQAQNHVNHGLLQTGKMLAFESYGYSQERKWADAFFIVNLLAGNLGDTDINRQIQGCWKTGKYKEAVKVVFPYCAGRNADETDKLLKGYGLTDGAASIDFSGTDVIGNDLCIKAVYRINLPFVLFGITHVDMHQQVTCGLWE